MKRLLNTLYVTDETVYLSLDGENAVCLKSGHEVFRIPLANIEGICCFGYLGCSPALMGKCAENGIVINFLSPYGKFLARVTGKIKGNVYLRKQQLELCEDKERSLNFVQNLIAAKLCNTRFVLNRSLRDHPEIDGDGAVSACAEKLAEAVNDVYEQSDLDVLRGIEGNCAKAYFNVFDDLILAQKDAFKLFERSKHPPLDRVNAVLSFLYTIYTAEYASALECVGLDPYIGIFHTLRPGRCSLACDLVEEGRPSVERLVLTMINLKILQADDFELQPSGAVFLNDKGRKTVLTDWQEKKRKDVYHPVLKEKIKFGLIPFVQASLLAKFVRGETAEYTPYLLR